MIIKNDNKELALGETQSHALLLVQGKPVTTRCPWAYPLSFSLILTVAVIEITTFVCYGKKSNKKEKNFLKYRSKLMIMMTNNASSKN